MPARHPSLFVPLALALLVVAGLTLAGLVKHPAFQTAWTSAGALIAFFALAALWDWWRDREIEYHERQAYTERQSPYSNILSLAAHLTPEQVAIVPRLENNTEIVVAVGSPGVAFLLHTETGLIPYGWLVEYLRNCGYMYLAPVNHYLDKTASRRYAVAFTEWLIARQLAVPASGPHAAAWMDDQARATAIKLLRVEEIIAMQEYANGDGQVETVMGLQEA